MHQGPLDDPGSNGSPLLCRRNLGLSFSHLSSTSPPPFFLLPPFLPSSFLSSSPIQSLPHIGAATHRPACSLTPCRRRRRSWPPPPPSPLPTACPTCLRVLLLGYQPDPPLLRAPQPGPASPPRPPPLHGYQPDPPAPVRVPLLRGQHDAAGGGAPLLRTPQRGRAVVPHLRRARRRRAPHRPRVHHRRGAVPHAARRGEAAVAHPRVRGQGRRALHARRARRRRAPRPREGGQDLWQDRPLLAGRPRRRPPARRAPDHDGPHPGGPAPARPRRLCGEEVRRVVPEGDILEM